MNEKKLLAGWAIAMVVIAGAYYAYTRYGNKAPVTTTSSTAANVDEEEKNGPDLGTALPRLSGDWITADGKAPELAGKVVLLDVWAIFCEPCKRAIPGNNKFFAEYAPKGLTFVGIAPEDTKDKLLEFKKTTTMDYPLLATTDDIIKPLHVIFLPSTFLFDKTGKLVWKGSALEDKGKLVPDFEKALTAALGAVAEPAKPEKTSSADTNPAFPAGFAELVAKSEKSRATEAEDTGPKVGEAMPPLKGAWLGRDGKDAQLATAGQLVVVECWTTACTSCVESIPHNNTIAEKFAGKLLFVGATPEPKERIAAFKTRTEMRYPVLCECDDFFKECKVDVLPATFIIDAKGRLAWRGGAIQTDGKLEPAFESAVAAVLKPAL